MALDGQTMFAGLNVFIGDDWSSTTTGAGSSTTLVDTLLGRYNDDTLIEDFLRITESGHTALWEVRNITDNAASTGTCTVVPAFGATTGSGKAYELHAWDPKEKFAAIDAAIISLSGVLPQVIYNETLTLDGIGDEYAIPTTVRKGPVVVQVERPIEVDAAWNLLANPRGDTLTSWTLSSAGSESVALYGSQDADLLVPKYDNNCTKITVPASTAVTYRQTVSNMSSAASASDAAGRNMTLGFWLYCQVSGRVSVEIVDDNGQVVASSTHGGAGWELLTVTGVVSPANATTLTVGITVTSVATALEVYFNRAWFMYGDQLPSQFPPDNSRDFKVRRDDTTARIIFSHPPRGKRQLRVIGTGPLSTLGTTLATQVTNTVEVDANSAEIIYAKAAQILFGKEVMATEKLTTIAVRIRVAEARLAELERQWHNELGAGPVRVGPYD